MLRSLALVGGTLIGLAFATHAEASYTTGAVHLRTGPGTGYGVITTAAPGAWVSVRNCAGNWCKVKYRGINGWMSAGYIGRGGSRYQAPSRDYNYAPTQDYYVPSGYVDRGPEPYYRPFLPFGNYGFSLVVPGGGG